MIIKFKRNTTALFAILCLNSAALLSSKGLADSSHYNNVLIGERAFGLAGAFGALANDPSGIFYNPAGLADARSSEISSSVNGYYGEKTTIKGLFAKDYQASHGNMVPTFFGGIRKKPNLGTEWVFGGGIYVPEQISSDRDEDIKNDPKFSIERWHQSLSVKSNQSFYGFGMGRYVAKDMRLGFGASYFRQEYMMHQSIAGKYGPFDRDSKPNDLYVHNSINNYHDINIEGIEPVVGVQYDVNSWIKTGLTIKKGLVFRRSSKQSFNMTTLFTDVNDLPYTSGEIPDQQRKIKIENEESSDQKIPKRWPLNARLGLAFNLGEGSLLCSDFDFHSSGDMMTLAGHRRHVTNIHLGYENSLSPKISASMGAFTNYDSGMPLEGYSQGKAFQDFFGGSIGILVKHEETRYMIGGMAQQGKGKTFLIVDPNNPAQTIESVQYGFTAGMAYGIE